MVEQRIEEITRANLAFYAAFESLDMLQMDKVWAHLEYVTCIHPGWSLRSDWPAVRDSWVLIFNNTFSMKFELSDVQVQVAGDLGWVICTEHLTSRQDDQPVDWSGARYRSPDQSTGRSAGRNPRACDQSVRADRR